MNRVVLVGRLTRDPELRKSSGDVPFATFSIAVNRTVPTASGERVADFINCIAFNRQAENLCRFIKKGGLIGVDGKIQTRRYNNKDGVQITATEVVCDNIHFLESRGASQGGYNDYSSYETPYMQQNNQSSYYQNQPQNNSSQNYNYNNHSDNQYAGNQNFGNQNVDAPSYNNYNSNPTANPYQSSAPQENLHNDSQDNGKDQEDQFDEVENQFNITDDDLPF